MIATRCVDPATPAAADTRLTPKPGPCQSRRVKSCGPSGSQDLAFKGDRLPFSYRSAAGGQDGPTKMWERVAKSPHLPKTEGSTAAAGMAIQAVEGVRLVQGECARLPGCCRAWPGAGDLPSSVVWYGRVAARRSLAGRVAAAAHDDRRVARVCGFLLTRSSGSRRCGRTRPDADSL
jgi:hypothetical protein